VTASGSFAGSRVTFVERPVDVPAVEPDRIVVVVDTTWIARPERPDVLSIRPALFEAIEQHDLFEEALRRLDAWAAEAGLPDHLLVEGVTYWYRLREALWRWLHERLLWRHTLGVLLTEMAPVHVEALGLEGALAEVLAQLTPGAATSAPLGPPLGEHPVGDGWQEASGIQDRPSRWIDRLHLRTPFVSRRSTVVGRRDDELARRVAEFSGEPGQALVILTTPSTYARVGSASRDQHLGSVTERLDRSGRPAILVGMGLDHRDDAHWQAISSDRRLLPQSLLRTRWAMPSDRDRAEHAIQVCDSALQGAAGVPLDVEGLDLAPRLLAEVRTIVGRVVRADVLQLARVERFLADIRPAGILLAQEGIRTPWLVAGSRLGIPVFAVQHGILYPTHPGYPDRRHPALVLPSRTFVFGPYERRVLLDGAYRPDEVEVSGAPRHDLDAVPPDNLARALERSAVREELGVASGDRLLVVSTLHLPFIQRSHFVHMLERLLGGPMPGVHVVFKQHPGERDEGPYRRFLEGLAEVGGYRPPPITVVRDYDLYRLLRAADAHLGLHSTVLTDAVVAGTLNLIAMVEPHGDLIGYVEAGVAVPVDSLAQVIAALEVPPTPDPARREAFLADHFLPGDAGARILASVDRLIEGARRADPTELVTNR